MVDNVFSNLTGPHVAEQDSGWSVSDIERSAYVRVTYAIISLFGLTGNALVIFVLVRIPSLRNRTSQFIIHLAFTDFLTCVWIIVFNLFPGSPAMPPGFLGDLICRIFINKFPLWATIFASVYSLVSVHLERFVAVVYPFKYKRLFTPSKSALIMLGCWLVGVISNSYFWFVYENEDGMCSIQPYPHFIIKRLVGVYTFSVVYIIPITFNFVVHKKMISVLKDKAAILESKEVTLANLDKVPGAKSARKREAWQVKAAQELSQTLLVVVITFAICWAPNQIFFFIYNMGVNLPFDTPIYHITVIMSLCNSCINPFIYFFRNNHYRVGLMKALSPICCSNKMKQKWGSVRAGPPPTNSTPTNSVNSVATVSRNNSIRDTNV